MRRFLITSPALQGTCELIFREDGTLCRIDMPTKMPAAIVRIFKERAPAHIDEIEPAFKNTNATVIEADFEVTFEMFWNVYALKINRKRAEVLWNKLSKTKQVQAWAGIAAYDKFLKKNTWRSKADPDTYLRNEMWESEWCPPNPQRGS